MQTINTPKTALPLCLLALCLYGCSKSSSPNPTPANPGGSTPPPKTIAVPTVDTATANFSPLTDVTYVAAHDSIVSGGQVVSDGGATVTARGVCWSTSQNPTIATNKTVNGTGTGFFSSPFDGLTVNTTYYIRAYATNSAGTGYSPEQHVTTAYIGGEYFEGGLIYTIDATTLHGLIVTAGNLGVAPWENVTFTSYLSAGAYSTTDGDANTTLIIKYFGTSGNAAALAKSCRDGGYTDWYLPSINELTTLVSSGVGNVRLVGAVDSYWSSTENINNIADAFGVQYTFGSTSTFTDTKNTGYTVRAIRAF